MTINWTALGTVAAVSLIIGVLVVVLVSTALLGLSAREPHPADGPTNQTPHTRRSKNRLSRTTGTILAAACLLSTTTIVLYGLYLLAV